MNRRVSGFSLVEVSLAMAIASIALVTLLAMLPQGMDTMREAGDEAIEARIHQQILSELQMSSFDNLDDYNNVKFFFDAQGEVLGDSMPGSSTGGDAEGSFEHIYTARIRIPESNISFDGGNEVNDTVRSVIMDVAAVTGLGEDFDWDDPAFRNLVSSYQTNVVKMGRDFDGISGE